MNEPTMQEVDGASEASTIEGATSDDECRNRKWDSSKVMCLDVTILPMSI